VGVVARAVAAIVEGTRLLVDVEGTEVEMRDGRLVVVCCGKAAVFKKMEGNEKRSQ
jgi:hypothetical protein